MNLSSTCWASKMMPGEVLRSYLPSTPLLLPSWGWDYTSYWRPAVNGVAPDKCFYTSPGKTCKDMFTYPAPNHVKRRYSYIHQPADPYYLISAPELTVIIRLDNRKPLAHEKNADSKLKQFYNESSANRITRFAKCDLQAFGYPEWNGTEADNFIRSIHKLPTTTNVEQKFGCYVDNC